MRILGLDTGTKRIGVAISDETGLIARGMGSIACAGAGNDIDAIRKIAEENAAGGIVVGLPLNMDGTDSAQTRAVREFIRRLSGAVAVPVTAWDERLTSVQAERLLLEADTSRRRRRELSDKVAAQLILQGYLDYQRTRSDHG